MGAAASMQRPEIGHLSVQAALDQGYDMETILLIKNQLEKRRTQAICGRERKG